MTAPPPRRPWWRRKRWWAALALWLLLPILYIAGSGPTSYAVGRGWISSPLHAAAYSRTNAAILSLPNPYGDAFRRYRNWWSFRALSTELQERASGDHAASD